MSDLIADRIRRARDESFSIERGAGSQLIEDPPISLESTSGDVYTLVPEHAYCSCPDFEHRAVPCKHLLALALDTIEDGLPSERRERLVRAIESEADRLDSVVEEIQQRLDEARSRRDAWDDAVDYLESHDDDVDPLTALASTAVVCE